MVKTKKQRIKSAVITCAILLVIFVILVLLCLGYPGKWIDQIKEKRSMATVVASFGDQKITKGDCVELYQNEANYTAYYYQYMNYMGSMYGIQQTYSMTKQDLLDIRDRAVKTAAETRVLYEKAKALGIGTITEEEDASMREEAKKTYQAYLEQQMAGAGSDEETARGYLALQGLTESMLYLQLKDSEIVKRLTDSVNTDTAVTDEEVVAKYDAMLAEQQTTYANGGSAFENAMTRGDTVCWMPEGYRTVKHILLAPEDETLLTNMSDIQTEIGALDAAAEDYETKAAELNAKLEDAKNAVLNDVTARADAIYAAIAEGADFDQLIAEYTADTASLSEPIKTNGYYVSAKTIMMDSAFTTPALALEKIGDVSQPSVGLYGAYIIKYVSDVVPGAIALDESNYETFETLALNEKRNAKYQEARTAWIEEAAISYNFDAWKID